MKGPAWLTADRSQLVPDGDPRAAFLAAGPGDDVPTGVPWADDLKQVDAPVADKQVDAPAADKAVKRPARKRSAKS